MPPISPGLTKLTTLKTNKHRVTMTNKKTIHTVTTYLTKKKYICKTDTHTT